MHRNTVTIWLWQFAVPVPTGEFRFRPCCCLVTVECFVNFQRAGFDLSP